jgi:hypothetical protein
MKRIGFKRGGLALLSFFMVGLACLVSSCEKDDEEKLPDGVTRIFVKTMPDVAYGLDSRLDLTTMVLSIERGEVTTDVPFSDFEKEGVTVDPPNGTVMDFSHHSLTITHKPSGRGIIQPLDVTNMVASLAVNVAPVAEYEVADTLDLSDLVISLIRENGETKNLAYSDFKDHVVTVPAQGDTLTEMNDKVIVTYLPTKVSMEIEIKVNPFLPQAATVINMPIVSYALGEKLDFNGLVMQYTLGNGNSIDIPSELFPFYGIDTSLEDSEVLGLADNSLTITHASSNVTQSIPLSVDPKLVVNSMYVSTMPKKSFYKVGDKIALDGIEVTLVRDDKKELSIPFKYFSKVNLIASPANGVDFDLSMPHVVITHAESGFTTKSPLKINIRTSALSVKLNEVNPDSWALKYEFQAGVQPYVDRPWTIKTFPNELRGLQWVQTNMDLNTYDGEEQVAGLNLPGAYTVYIAHSRLIRPTPDWILENWETTGLTMRLSNNLPFIFYKKDFDAGEEVKLYKFANEANSEQPPYILLLERR